MTGCRWRSRGPWRLGSLLLGLAACGQGPSGVGGYDLDRAVLRRDLPKDLREVSGVVAIGPQRLAALQDEKGAMHRIDLETGVVERVKFGRAGDYEGLASDGERYWVLRSDGVVLRLRADGDRFRVDERGELTAPQDEFEGLCWDPVERALLVAPKALLPDREDRDLRPLYLVDPESLEQRREPLLTIRRSAVVAAARTLGVALPARKHGEVQLRLRFSEVSVHPVSGELWLLSAVDHALLVVARDGHIRGLHVFDPAQLPQPEGLTFLPDCRLVVASEGDPAVLRVYAPLSGDRAK